MKITFLGTNGWFTSETGNTACILIELDNHNIILDAGNGFYKLKNLIDESKPTSLFLTHVHLDHIFGFHTFPKFHFAHGIDVFLPVGKKTPLLQFVNPPYTMAMDKFPFQVRCTEVEPISYKAPVSFQPFEMRHQDGAFGYRFEIEGKTICYSGDTQVFENSFPFAQHADVLIHESTWLEAPAQNNWGHADPVTVAELAKEANVKKLYLTHFDPYLFPTLQDRDKSLEIAKPIFSNTEIAKDGLSFEL